MSAIISDPSGREAAINFINGNLGYGDANNVSRFQGFEGSPQEFTELTGLRIVKTTAQNLDDQFDVDPSVKIDKQPADAFLTIVGPNGIYKHTSGGGQRVLPPDQPGLPDDDGGEDRNPEISTQAEFAGDADQVVAGAKVTDTVEYKDLVPGKKYTLNAELVNKADKSVVGKGEKTFTPQESAGKVDVEITVDSDVTEPVEAAVAFEELTSTEVDAKGEETPDAEKPNKVAEHKDIDDADQTVTSKKDEKPEKSDRNPEISTQAEFAGDADQVVAGAKVTDTVEYKDLVPGKKYTLNAELVNKADKSVVGKGEKTFTPQESAGKVDVEITVDSDVTEPVEAAVAFEELTSTEVDAKGEETPDAEKPNKVAEHKDIDDADQTVTSKKDEKPEKSDRNPEISTQAEFAGDADQVVAGAKVTDTVEYKDLVPGKKYTLNAELVNKADKSVVGKGEKTFTPQESAGKVDVEITVDSDVTEPVEAAVAFEELTSTEVDAKGEETPDAEKPNKVAEHKDIDDADQTVTSKKDEKPEKSDRNPEISTQAEFAGDADQVVAGAKVTDTVEYKDLVPGKKYTLNAELVNKADKSVVGKGEKTFTPQESAGKVDVEITVDSDVTEPVEAAVAFEELTSTEVDAKGEETPDAEKPNKVAEHKDIDDADQTVTSKKDEKPEKDNKPSETSTPMTSTSSSKPSTSESKSSEPKKETTSESKPSEPSETKTSSSKTSANAKPSTSTSSEKSKEPRPTEVQGQEPGDSPEPKITTDADFAEGSHVVVAGAKIVDEVSYEGLVPGKEYTLKAELISKKDEKTVLGTGEKTFTPEKSAGKVDVEITVHDDVTEPVEAAVAFEELTSVEVDAKGEETPDAEKPNKVAEHKDIDDADQTVTSKKDEKPEKSDRNPEISTQAEFAGDADQVVAGAKVTDTVEYKDLVPGKKYTLNAELVNKADKSVVGKGEKTFTPQESAGKVDVEITVDSDVTEPVEAAVAFEELTSTEVDAKGEETPDAEKPNKVAEHKDIDDADQTVTSKKDEKPEKSDRNPEISTQAEFAGDADQVVAGAKVTDTVEYKDLVPGKKYTLNAELVNKADKSVVGKGEKTFTPQESAGKVDVEITVDSDVTEPVEAAVAFEELTSTEVDAKGEETPDAEKPNKVAEHKDIDDADQTVTSKKDEKPEKDNKPSETSTPMTSTSSSKPSTSESKSSEPKKETTSESKPSEPSETKTSSSKTSANAKPSTSTSSEKSKEPRPTEVQGQEPGDSPEPKITTDADFAEGSHVVVAGAKIVDEVSYEGLVPGKEYTLKAELISKKDEKTVLGTGEKTFTPEKSAGKVDVEITVHDDVTEPVEAAVAFEELTSVEVDAKGEETPDVTPEKPNHIAEHKDINDDDQTVTSKKDEKPESKPKEKAEGQSERPSVKVKEQDAPAQADKGTGKVEQHVDITNHVPGKTGKPLPSDAKRTEIKSVPSGATELEPGMQTYIK
ncbi:VaFE repeat-containing surface-anchored protein [Corynebacterium rhinophilum]|uniref:VaFE repeat-containing surface-anchored protein n=1 Tax=Corynebacterium rhinophilum TaxID=3050197 RepID=UPI00397A72A3